jgi:hypothetical protein
MRNGADMARQPEMADWIQQAVMAAGDLFYDWDLTTDNIVWAGQGAQIFGEDSEPLKRGERFLQRVNPEDIPLRLKSLSSHVSDNTPYDCEYRIRSDNGAFAWVSDRGSVIRAGNGMPQRLVGSLRLITARKNHEARLERMASFDELTGHLNHVRLREALDHAIEYNRRAEIPGAYLVIGVDKLSVINNTLGPCCWRWVSGWTACCAPAMSSAASAATASASSSANARKGRWRGRPNVSFCRCASSRFRPAMRRPMSPSPSAACCSASSPPRRSM